MRLRIGGLAALCALVGCAALLLAPLAQAEWLPPVEISETAEHAGQPHVALDSEGNATAVWDRWDGTATVVETAYRPAGAPWGEPEVLSPPASWGAHVVVDRNGVLTATWQRWASTNHFAIESVSRLPGHEWAEPVEITEFEQGFHPEPWLAVDWEGNTTVVWTQGERIMSSFRTFALGWGEPVPLSPAGSFTPQTAMDARGDATAVWLHGSVVESAYRPEQGEWEAATPVSQPGESGGNPQVAVDAQGDSLVVWHGEDEGVEFVRASYRLPGGSWSEPVNVSNEGERVQSVRAAVDPEGNAIVAWSASFGNIGEYEVVHTSYKPAGGEWEEPVPLSEEGANGYVNDVVFDQSGNAAILWIRWDGVTWSIHGAYRPKGEEWAEPVQLSEEGRDGMDPTLVLDAPGSATTADGDATAIWISTDPVPCPGEESFEGPCHTYVVQAAGYDPDGLPEVEVEAPEEGTVGEEIEVSTPTEGLYSPSIDFGDGEKVAGTEATHVYDEPGTYLVRAAGAEELGYLGVAEHTIEIVAGSGDEEPAHEEEPGPGGKPQPQAGDGGSASQPPAQAAPDGPPPGCLKAKAARAAAAARLRRVRVRLESAESPRAQRRLVAVMGDREAALRRARARVAAAC
ncbi:MAG TPA: PKD domain-containing protein [Solirubrobacterales bacterium]|nr:PKD domain-containing protein [Solirubrobacterales bacterium]